MFVAVITLLVSRRLLLAVQERLRRTSYKIPEQRWAAIFAAAAPAILEIVVLSPRVSKVIARRLEPMLLHEAPDPKRSRQLLIEGVEYGYGSGSMGRGPASGATVERPPRIELGKARNALLQSALVPSLATDSLDCPLWREKFHGV